MADLFPECRSQPPGWFAVFAVIASVLSFVVASSAAIGPANGYSVRASSDTTDSTVATGEDTSRPWHDAAWNRILTVSGVHISYIYYAEATEVNDGVVIRLENTNDESVRVAFTIVFRSTEGEVSDRFSTVLEPHQMKTGTNDDLYWIPFGSDETIAEVGLRGVDVRPISVPPG